MIPLPERKAPLWGTEYDVIPYLVSSIHGDGKQWLWFRYMDDRPWFYVVRVDSSVRAKNDNEQWRYDVLEWIENQIEDEGTTFLSDEQYDEWREKGYIEGDRPWPCPPLEAACGSDWGGYDPSAEDLATVKNDEEGENRP